MIVGAGADRDYRADIQLMRALAVVLVIGFHLGITGFANGFLGVDIFFVISGYLMATLYRPREGALAFYRRRAARLLPAYFVTIAATLAAAMLLSLPNAVAEVAQQAAWAAAFSANIGFWAGDSYFSANQFNPLLHLWSLGVEFHYYLIVPLLALLPWRRWSLGAMILLSLAACLVMTGISPKTSFFLLPFRLWEFGAGMAIAYWRARRVPIKPLWWIVAAIFLGIALILPVDGTVQSAWLGHPGGGAALAVAATALALASRLDGRWMRGMLARAAIRLGDISYSLYLVHYPLILFAFARPFERPQLGDGSAKALLLIPIMLLLAIALHALVERPGHRWMRWGRVAFASAATLLLTWQATGLSLLRFDNYEQRLSTTMADRAEYRCGKLFRLAHPREAFCPLNDAKGPPILLVGDSHADAIKRVVAEVAARRGAAVQLSVSNDPLLTPALDPEWLAAEAARGGARTVLLHYHSDHLTPELVDGAAEALAKVGVPLTVMLPVPEREQAVPALLFDAHRAGRPLPDVAIADYRRRTDQIRAFLDRRPDIDRIDPAAVLCAASCPLGRDDGTSFYFDANHLTLGGAHRLAPLLDDWMMRREATRDQP